MQTTQLALLPLTSHILPSGRLPIRITEERYIRMIKDSTKTMSGFGVVMIDPNQTGRFGRIPTIGTHVEIIDFYTLDDGFLGINVEGRQRFIIDDITTEADGLKVAKVHYITNWPDQVAKAEEVYLADKLEDLYKQHADINQLCALKDMANISWVSQRWIELLPLSVSEKQILLQSPDCNNSISILKTLMPT
ncbi:LON peptidase substrate-binding domain-containing protein [Moritella sp. F3]|uniref:LON peptidase substrate-binding domain-containing protein n=1 Tax=Moritella sp. F3 TaxID=2718882 RepID=UPI0018E1C0FE|nr:LON peptidase substrate-binding domain-containing protein [Moritella sp. F3]GIC79606.1 ATP-dependent protease [Moritella sp. F1]GIC79906.1 ATP-dependent protease [Moritella sp. F3]